MMGMGVVKVEADVLGGEESRTIHFESTVEITIFAGGRPLRLRVMDRGGIWSMILDGPQDQMRDRIIYAHLIETENGKGWKRM